MNGFITCTKRGYVTRMLLFLVNYVLTAKFSQKQILTKFPNFLLWNSKKEIAFCESTGRELSFEWPQHRILSADSKVTFTLQNSIKHSGSERVKSQIFSWVTDMTKISSKSQQAALPITIFWVIFAGIALKVRPTLSQSVFILGVILAIFCNRRKETVSILKHSLWNNKARPFYWCEFRY